MESAKFRFSNGRDYAIEFDAVIISPELLAADLDKNLRAFLATNKGKRPELQMYHDKRWMPLNYIDGSVIYSGSDPSLWSERNASEILDKWANVVSHSDNINALIGRAIKHIHDT